MPRQTLSSARMGQPLQVMNIIVVMYSLASGCSNHDEVRPVRVRKAHKWNHRPAAQRNEEDVEDLADMFSVSGTWHRHKSPKTYLFPHLLLEAARLIQMLAEKIGYEAI